MDEGGHRHRVLRAQQEDEEPPAPDYVHPYIISLRLHRAAHRDEVPFWRDHLTWPCYKWCVTCPCFIHALQAMGLDAIRHLQFIRLDSHLITTMVEHWYPYTNTFYFLVGEMTITLQDVTMILGIRIDGPRLINEHAVGLKGGDMTRLL